MTRIVRTAYRYKRPPRRKQPVALEVPGVVKAVDPAKARPSKPPAKNKPEPSAPAAANDDGPTEPAPRPAAETKSAIVTARKPGARFADVPDMTPEEHRRRGDAADAMFREMKRRRGARPARRGRPARPRRRCGDR
jgi:hypothetical protein